MFNFIPNFMTMRKLLLLLLSLTIFVHAKSAITNPSSFYATNTISIKKDNPPSKLQLIAKMKVKQLENYLGRKLKFNEKIAFRLLKYKAKHSLKNDNELAAKKGKTSLILGICALVTLFLFPLATIPLGILAITNGKQAVKLNPDNSDGKTGIVLGIISLGIIALGIILLIAVISSLGGF
jgi:hypothetical protein